MPLTQTLPPPGVPMKRYEALAADIDVASYGYPLANPFEATIATTPP